MVARTKRTRKREITFRPITAPATLASDLYAEAYAPVVKAWSEASERIVEQYGRSLATLDGLTVDSPAEVGAVLSATEDAVTRILISIRLRLEAWALRTERWHRGRWSSNVKAATGVDIATMIGPKGAQTTVGAAIERNVGLVRSISEQARTRIGEAVFRGLNKRAPAADVAKEIREATGMARRRALNVAADQTVKITAQLNQERRREAGIDTWEWVSSHKLHFRPEHADRDGKRYSDDDAPEDTPGELPYCGCTERAVLSLTSEF
ncbi:MAG: minor capsid protein [Sphingomonadaceae bacterium]|nr:minor capsid protein [Sphingomonadaceae bacterium]